MKTRNPLGESEFSAPGLATTALLPDLIPTPEHVIFNLNSAMVNFNVILPSAPLVALVNVKLPEVGWRTYQSVVVKSSHGEIQLPQDTEDIQEVALKLCLHTNTSICGDSVTAEFGKFKTTKSV